MGQIVPLDSIPSILIEDVIHKMTPGSAVRLYCTAIRAKEKVEKLRPHDILYIRKVNDDFLWKGCMCEEKKLINSSKNFGITNAYLDRQDRGNNLPVTQSNPQMKYRLDRLICWQKSFKASEYICEKCQS